MAELHGIRRIALETVSSTNDEAIARGKAGDSGNLWITAERQKQGRGRMGASWASDPGNLYASLLLVLAANQRGCESQLPLVAALALHDAVLEAAGSQIAGQRLKIKWPNDLLLDQQKISGILAESRADRERMLLVVGFGVNCTTHPVDTSYPATDLATAGVRVSKDRLFDALTSTVSGRLATWNFGAGFTTIRKAWLDRAAGIGAPIKVRLPDQTLSGTFSGLDSAGRLLLAAADQERLISAGDVFFPEWLQS